jgi:hypothetical protein
MGAIHENMNIFMLKKENILNETKKNLYNLIRLCRCGSYLFLKHD